MILVCFFILGMSILICEQYHALFFAIRVSRIEDQGSNCLKAEVVWHEL